MDGAADTGSSPGVAGFSAIPTNIDTGPDPFAERPEIFAAGAFAGGLALALALRWLGRNRDV